MTSCTDSVDLPTCNGHIEDAQHCVSPENLLVEKLDCNTFRFSLENEDFYGTTVWNSDDVQLEQRETENGSVEITFSEEETLTEIYGKTECCKGGTPTFFEFRFVDVITRGVLRSPQWLDSPPAIASLGQVFVLTLENPPLESDNFQVEWNSSPGISIQGPGSTARIKCDRTGEQWVKVTYINDCDGEEKTLEEVILVY